MAAGAELLDADMSARLDRARSLRDRTAVLPLTGGITNRNFKVTTPHGTYVARVSSPDSSLLAIDRDVEHVNSVAAARSGAGAPVIEYVPDAGILVVAFIEGRTFGDEEVREPSNLPRIAAACRQLHAGPPFAGEFDMFALQRKYLAIVHGRGYRLPPDYLDHTSAIQRMEACLDWAAAPKAPCNNDLLAANFIDSGDRLWLIDYEYSGTNDPMFELGNIWSEAGLDPPLLAELVAAYHGGPSRRLTARAWLWAVMSKYGWTLWASIQDGSSTIDFDFWSWGMEKYDRARRDLTSLRLAQAMEEVAAPD